MPRLVIAGVQSGVGKTTVTLGLMAAWVKKGMDVRGFKVGPDYLDPTYYRKITGKKAYNLDGWMTSKEYVRRLFSEVSRNSDISIVEGVMGLYDGFGAISEEGSTAQVAKWLDAPVILVVDAKGMSRSVCAILKGYASFDGKVNLAGVIFNNLGSERHFNLLKDSVAENLRIPVLGGLPRDDSIRLRERYLGLHPATEESLNPKLLSNLILKMEKHVDLEAALSIAHKAPPLQIKSEKPDQKKKKTTCSIGVAFDDAFNFYYEDNFRLLEKFGASIIFFSPIRDGRLPAGIDGLYLGGGYPECFAQELTRNQAMLSHIREFAEAGNPVYAECGGLLYLSESVRLKNGEVFPMAGIFPFQCRMHEKRKALGYVEATIRENSILGKKGVVFRGHEFHYSEIDQNSPSVHMKYVVSTRKEDGRRPEGFSHKNVLASYIHAHFGSQPELAENFVRSCGSG